MLALALPRLLVLAKLLLPFLTTLLSRCKREIANIISRRFGVVIRQDIELQEVASPTQSFSSNTTVPPRTSHREGGRIAHGAVQTFSESTSFENAAWLFIIRHLAMNRIGLHGSSNWWTNALRNLQEDVWTFTWLSAISLLLFLLFLGQQIIAITSASIVSGSTALSASPYCGAWLPHQPYREGSNMSNIHLVDDHYIDLDRKVMAYVDTCYGDDAKPEECVALYKSRIPFNEVHNATCPFQGDMCLFGNTSAFSMDTGYLDSSILGVNKPHRCQFRLKKTCAPLVVNDTYVRSSPLGNGVQTKVVYYYGDFIGYSTNTTYYDQHHHMLFHGTEAVTGWEPFPYPYNPSPYGNGSPKGYTVRYEKFLCTIRAGRSLCACLAVVAIPA